MKTLAIRLEDELHARLTILSKVGGQSVTDTIRNALEAHLAALAAQPDTAARAEALTAEIKRDAEEQLSAIQALLGPTKSNPRPARPKS